ncbi:hypothetical protein BJ973_001415 [Actinoplanes tereljensis]|uniref:DUF4352 domain-containing protein n=1 Tax=Paractinoplanes tereljensis TaxID=571912 RepID=A0A919NKY0_9ACTN|nr:DUF4352 domain-containing protein [Actinoplanes tereljensis]GIF20679.1 hypothetical protein Ate02nite_34090 [Actinoplanes tereljensis]
MAYHPTMSSSPSVSPAHARHRRRRGGIIAATAVLVVLGGGAVAWFAIGRGGSDGDAAAPVVLGSAGRDGVFAFVVTELKCGTKTVGTGTAASTAQGIYCLVGIKVTNRTDTPRTFDGSAQKVFDGTGTEYTSDTSAERQANPFSWTEAIVPSETVAGRLVFDVPAGTKLTEIELHETLLSPGVRMALR